MKKLSLVLLMLLAVVVFCGIEKSQAEYPDYYQTGSMATDATLDNDTDTFGDGTAFRAIYVENHHANIGTYVCVDNTSTTEATASNSILIDAGTNTGILPIRGKYLHLVSEGDNDTNTKASYIIFK